MKYLFFTLLVTLNTSFAEVGKVLKVVGNESAYLIQNQDKISVAAEVQLNVGDELFSNESVVLIQITPGTEISLSKKSHIKIFEHSIELNDGIIRVKVTNKGKQEVHQKVTTKHVAFSATGAEFEILIEDSGNVELDVFDGDVEVTSPHIQTFVPEIVKAREGHKFNLEQKSYSRRKFSPQFLDHPGFVSDIKKSKIKSSKKKKGTRVNKL